MPSNLPIDLPGTVAAVPSATLGAADVRAVRTGFPGPMVTGACLVAAPVCAVAATLLGSSSYDAGGTKFVGGMIDHSIGFGVGVQLALASMMLLLLAVIGLAGMVTAVRPAWGRAAGIVTVLGLCGPISFESVYWAASKITDTTAHRAAAAVLIDRSQVIPRSIMNISGPCLVIGFILLGIAAAKSGVLGRPRATLLGATCLIPVGFISGHLAISAVAFFCTALALVPLGVDLLRGR